MTCPKCKGLVINDEFNHFDQWVQGERCLNCGHVKFNEQKVINNANQTKTGRVDELDELQLYRDKRNSNKYSSYYT